MTNEKEAYQGGKEGVQPIIKKIDLVQMEWLCECGRKLWATYFPTNENPHECPDCGKKHAVILSEAM